MAEKEEDKPKWTNNGELFDKLFKFLEDEFGSKDNILAREATVTKDTSKDYDVLDLLGRPARTGYLISDDGNIEFCINNDDKNTVTVQTDENFPFDDKNLAISQIKIRTDSATELGFRLVLA